MLTGGFSEVNRAQRIAQAHRCQARDAHAYRHADGAAEGSRAPAQKKVGHHQHHAGIDLVSTSGVEAIREHLQTTDGFPLRIGTHMEGAHVRAERVDRFAHRMIGVQRHGL